MNPDNTFKIVTHYDGEGKVVSTNEDGHTKTVYKDLVGRTVKEETTNAGVVSTVMYEYDKVGNVVKVTDANNNITTNVYDSRGRISSVSNTVDGVGNITSYSYDGYSNILKETYPNGNTKTTLYDELNRAIRVVDALNKIEYVKYDKMGNIVKIIDRKGGIVTFEYDTRGRLTKRTAGTIIELTAYDKVDRITAKTGSSGTRTYEYFANGQLKKETNEDSKSIQYEYDVLGRKTEMSDYYGETTTYGYNSLNKLISVRGIGTIYYEYYPDGMLKKKTSGSEVFHLYTYNSLNQLTKLEHENSNGLLSTYDYTYDKNGNELTKKTTKDGKVKTEIYTYDVLNRVKTSNDGTSVVTFYYDKNGNITKEAVVVSGATVNTVYTYDANNRLLKKTVGTGDILEFYYDNNGNLINKAQGAATGTGELSAHAWGEGPVAELGKTAIYEYNALNQLVKYSDLKGVNVSYSYSVTGLRDTKTYNGNAIKYYYDGENVVNESTNGTQSATNLNGLQTELRNKDSFEDMYLMYDGHGDVASLRTYSGLFEGASYEYDIYGKEEVVTGTFDNPIRYTGQYYDAETGMYYLRARYYDPDVRRFISEDTHWNVNNMIYGDRVYQDGEIRIPDIAAIMQSRNLYGYCMGNPVRYIDPSGLRTYVLNGINNGKPEGSPEDVEAFAQSLRDGGVKDVRTIGVYNGTGIFDGAGQAIMEMLNNGKYADAVATKIKEDLKNNPLADGEQLNIVGYSGGGQIAFNAAEKMAGTKKIDNVVLIGAPVMELISNVNKTVSIWAGWDPLSWNIGWGVTFRFAGWFGHTSYFNDKNRGNVAGIANEYIN